MYKVQDLKCAKLPLSSALYNSTHHLWSKKDLKANLNKFARKRTQWMSILPFILSQNKKNSFMFLLWTSSTYMCMESAVKYLCYQTGIPVT